MCGIAGILSQDPNGLPFAPEHILDAMLSSQAHRGPDGSGKVFLTYPDLHLSLGHRRLSVIDLSESGHQPMPNVDKSFWISSNNEIYNYRELRKELSSQYNFRSQSDTEVLLYAFQKWGAQALDRLRGMFAFGIWDVERKSLFLARDRLGVKPLYYYHDSKSLIFASEIRSLLATGLIAKKIDPQGLYQYLAFGRLQAPNSMIQGIKELPPGHYCEWREGEVVEKPYWVLEKKRNGSIPAPSLEIARNAIESAVQSHLVSDVPVGSFLSGGIDSSALVSLVSKVSKDNRTLSVVFGEKTHDESVYARLLASQTNSNHSEFLITDGELLQSLPDFLNAMDQPTVDGVNVYMISRRAKELGWKVALSGLGSDEIFGGYNSFQLFPQLIRLLNLPQSLQKVLSKTLKLLKPFTSFNADKYIKLIDLLDKKYGEAQAWYLFRSLFSSDDLQSLFNDKSMFQKQSLRHFENTVHIRDKIKDWDLFDQISYLEITQYMAPTLLKDADVMGMSHGLEIRVPFMDHPLVESIFSFPANFKNSGNVPKSLLVNSLVGLIPEEVVNRKKMGFTLPFETWMRHSMRAEIESVLKTPVPALNELLDEKGVQIIWQRFLDEKTSWSRPWTLYVLKKWALLHL
ncbi:MAG: asparagine synthase (glutamine-hydrolyzing) [Nitrospinae bacterium CG11_big_fil_rev_8_21_14_0_20_45_15]|nr:MAG: asparagine synthase (glutamine-hydrolyzing) [Nitrospinae bacterium CG11_big_fil_rev_8_21_14_0_20_45_15]